MIDFRTIGGDEDLARQNGIEIIRVAPVDIFGRRITGLALSITLEDLGSGLFWNGSSFLSPSPAPVAMSALAGNDHRSGLYEYIWNVPDKGIIVGTRIEWNVRAAAYIVHKGRFVISPASPIEPEQPIGFARSRFPRRRWIPTRDPNHRRLR